MILFFPNMDLIFYKFSDKQVKRNTRTNRYCHVDTWSRLSSKQHLLTYLLTYLLTPWCRVLLEKLTGSQLVKKFPAFYETRKFIAAFTSASHLFLS